MSEIKNTARMQFIISLLFGLVLYFPYPLYVYAESLPAVRAGEFIVKMKSTVSQGESIHQKSVGLMMANDKGSRILNAMGRNRVQLMNRFDQAGMLQIKSNDQQTIEELKSNPDVEFVEPNYILSLSPTDVGAMAVPKQNDDYYSQTFSNVEVTESWPIAKPYGHATSRTIVAVIDTGVDINHSVFANSTAVWQNPGEIAGNGIDDDGNGYVDDINGWNFLAGNKNVMDDNDHGTHVAGIVVGTGFDIFATPVRESLIRIMPLKFLDYRGSGSTSDAISAIMYAVNNGAKVINNSWGGPNYSRALHEAYTYAYNHNVVVVSAAGNDSMNIDSSPTYPAALDTPGNITVASTEDNDYLSDFSNYSSSGLVHIAAPGSGVLSPVPIKAGRSCNGEGCFRCMSGTSMAAPFVAGVAALAVREAPQLSAYQIRGLVLSSVDIKGNLSGQVMTSGRINAKKAVQAGKDLALTAFWKPDYTPVYKASSRSVASEKGGGAAAGCGLVKALVNDNFPGGGSSVLDLLAIAVCVFSPVVLAFSLRNKKPAYKRKYERYNIAKEMKIQIDDQVVSLVSNSVSVGGFSFSKDLNIDKGQKIKVKLDSQEVDAEIVWCNQNKSFGVKFMQVTDALKKEVESWTTGLIPSST